MAIHLLRVLSHNLKQGFGGTVPFKVFRTHNFTLQTDIVFRHVLINNVFLVILLKSQNSHEPFTCRSREVTYSPKGFLSFFLW